MNAAAPAPQPAPYGTWTSPITAAAVAAGVRRFDRVLLDSGDVYWIEGRASEAGRHVLMRWSARGELEEVTPTAANVRSRVHEYGGGAFTVEHGVVFYVEDRDQRVYRLEAGTTRALTPPGPRFADLTVDGGRRRLLAVREDHGRAGSEPINSIAAVSTVPSFVDDPVRTLVSGADFYAHPVISPEGAQLAWLQWSHPQMPWDGTELWTGRFGADGGLAQQQRVAGGANESILQPEWSPDGRLHFLSDTTGWWNLYRLVGGRTEPVCPLPADAGRAHWTFGSSSYAFLDARRLVFSYCLKGQWRLGLVELDRGLHTLELPLEPIEAVQATSAAVYFIGGSSTAAPAIARVTLATGTVDVLRAASDDLLPAGLVSVPEPIAFLSTGAKPGEAVHAFYYPPHHPAYRGRPDERPPLLVISHGGPTDAARDTLDPRIQFWTSRGFAVLDVNYRGSTGFGRAYRTRLNGYWGVLDVDDVVGGAQAMVDRGLADAERLLIRGGSAGGFTTLAALTFRNAFKAGASYYGIGDLELLARDTHKFESRYLERLVGPYPEQAALYRARSPIHAADRLSAAIILFQGLEDTVVPPNQAETMVDAVKRKGLPVAYLAFAGEQHGFRQAATIARSLEAELYFYGAVLGFTPADPIEPVTIENLLEAGGP